MENTVREEIRIEHLEDRLADAATKILHLRTSDECPKVLHADLVEIESMVAAVSVDLDQFDDDPECDCPDCHDGEDDSPDTLERIARWLEGKALADRDSEVWSAPLFLRELARDIRDGRIG